MLNTNHPTARKHADMPDASKDYESSSQSYNEIIRNVAKRDGGVILNDVGAHILSGVAAGSFTLSELVLDDGLHLSERGHDIYLDFLSPLVVAAIRANA